MGMGPKFSDWQLVRIKKVTDQDAGVRYIDTHRIIEWVSIKHYARKIGRIIMLAPPKNSPEQLTTGESMKEVNEGSFLYTVQVSEDITLENVREEWLEAV